MGITHQDWKKQQKKKALGMLKALQEKIRNDELVVESYGYWEATRGKWNFRVIAKESEDSQDFEQST